MNRAAAGLFRSTTPLAGLLIFGAVAIWASPCPAGLIGLWQFDSNSPSQVDSSAFGNTATANGNAAWTFDSTRNSGVMTFDGNNDYLLAPDSPSLSVSGDMTIAAWINVGPTLGSFGNWRGVVGKGTDGSGTPGSFQLWYNQNDLQPWFIRGDGVTGVGYSPGVAHRPDQDTWEHVAVSMSGTTVSYYRNGTLVGTGTINTSMADTDGPLYIGNRPDLVTDWLGRMDDVALFDSALTEEQIDTIMGGDFDQFTAVPEPSSFALVAGLVGGAWWKRRRCVTRIASDG